ncbi:hypothetical protein [Lignipirellula cremea]|nr:hypothetical protein [Lignipirellula cremea]
MHLRGTIGLHYHRVEVFTGYDYFRIGDFRSEGIVAGLRIWL